MPSVLQHILVGLTQKKSQSNTDIFACFKWDGTFCLQRFEIFLEGHMYILLLQCKLLVLFVISETLTLSGPSSGAMNKASKTRVGLVPNNAVLFYLTESIPFGKMDQGGNLKRSGGSEI